MTYQKTSLRKADQEIAPRDGKDSTEHGAGVVLFGRRALLCSLSAAVFAVLPSSAQEVDDDRLYDRVRRQLVNDRDLKILDLEVEVKDGVVTVAGYVRTEKILARVDKVAKKVKGVKEVVNKVEVRP